MRRRARLGALIITSTAFLAGLPAGGPAGAQPPTPPRIGPETPVGDRVLGPAAGDVDAPDIASGEDGFLAVWEDSRQCCEQTIFGSLLDEEGNPIDPVGFRIGAVGGYETDPNVVWDGTNYVVVWEDSSIHAARVSAEGRLIDENPITVVAERDNHGAFDATVASTGEGVFVAWTECAYKTDRCRINVFGAVMGSDGTVGERMPLATGPGGQNGPVLAEGPDGLLLAWSIGRDEGTKSEFMMLDRAGVPNTPPVTIPAYGNIGAAYDEGAFLIAWDGYISGEGSVGVRAHRVTAEGEVMEETPLVVTQEAADFVDVTPHPDGGWSVVWLRGHKSKLFGSRVDADGNVTSVGSEPVVDGPGEEWDAGLAWRNGRATLVWYPSTDQIYVATGDGLEGLRGSEPVLLSQSSNEQAYSSVAWNGEVFLVVWTDVRGDRKEEIVYAARVTPGGQVLDGSGIHLVTPGPGWTTPVVASDGHDFLVVWAFAPNGLERDLYAARVNAAGEVLDVPAIVVSDAPKTKTEPDVAWTGDHYQIVWEDYRAAGRGQGHVTGSGYSEIYGARVSADGEVLDPEGVVLAGGKKRRVDPDISSGPAGTAVVWGRDCKLNGTGKCTGDVFGRPISSDGAPGGPPVRIGASDAYEAMPDVVATPEGFLAAWMRYAEKSSEIRLRGISSEWGLLPVHGMESSEELQDSPRLAWSGDLATLSWITNGICLACGGDIVAMRVDAEGISVDPEPTPVATTEMYETITGIASTGLGCAALTYHRDNAEPGVVRSFVRLFGDC